MLYFTFIRARSRVQNLAANDNLRLRQAVLSGNLQTVRALLQIPAVRNNPIGALRLATAMGNIQIVRAFLAYDSIKQQTALMVDALLTAAERHHYDLVDIFLEIDNVADNLTVHNRRLVQFLTTPFAQLSQNQIRSHIQVLEKLLNIPSVQQFLLENNGRMLVNWCKENPEGYHVASKILTVGGMTLAEALKPVDSHFSVYLRRYLADPGQYFADEYQASQAKYNRPK